MSRFGKESRGRHGGRWRSWCARTSAMLPQCCLKNVSVEGQVAVKKDVATLTERKGGEKTYEGAMPASLNWIVVLCYDCCANSRRIVASERCEVLDECC